MARVVCVFRDKQDYSRGVFEWLENFRRRTGREIEVMDPDKEQGFCEAYDVVAYPTIIAIDENGGILMSWSGTMMPLIDEVSYYMMQ